MKVLSWNEKELKRFEKITAEISDGRLNFTGHVVLCKGSPRMMRRIYRNSVKASDCEAFRIMLKLYIYILCTALFG